MSMNDLNKMVNQPKMAEYRRFRYCVSRAGPGGVSRGAQALLSYFVDGHESSAGQFAVCTRSRIESISNACLRSNYLGRTERTISPRRRKATKPLPERWVRALWQIPNSPGELCGLHSPQRRPFRQHPQRDDRLHLARLAGDGGTEPILRMGPPIFLAICEIAD